MTIWTTTPADFRRAPARAVETAGLWTSPVRLRRLPVDSWQEPRQASPVTPPAVHLPTGKRTCPQPLDNCCAVAHSSHSPGEALYMIFQDFSGGRSGQTSKNDK